MPYQPSDILLDKYKIETLLGQGAFGDVYRVTHISLGVTRAIKVLRHDTPGVGSSTYNDAQQRFQLEAQLGARLNNPVPNPHLLQVYDFVSSEELIALEMEYAPGGSLSDRIQKSALKSEPIPVTEALQITAEVAQGLGALHMIDVIHRDLKPSNILFDGHYIARLGDLGLAQIPHGPSRRSQLSTPEPHPGTPGYMSPEQERSGAYLNSASDVYSLGLILFEMLTGRMYINQKPGTRPSKFRSDIPGLVDDLLAKMLAENPKERPWDGNEAAGLLREVLEKLKNGHVEEQVRNMRAAEAEAVEKARLAAAAENERQQAIRTAQTAAVENARREREQKLEMEQFKIRAESAEKARQAAETRAQVAEAARRETERTQYHAKREPEKSFFARFWWVGLIVGLGLAFCIGSFLLNGLAPKATPAPIAATAMRAAPAVNTPLSQELPASAIPPSAIPPSPIPPSPIPPSATAYPPTEIPQVDTSTPLPTSIPDTQQGSVLEAGQPWRQGNKIITVRSVKVSSAESLYIELEITNTGSQRISFPFSTNNIQVQNNRGQVGSVEFGYIDDPIILDPGQVYGTGPSAPWIRVSGLSAADTSVTDVTISISIANISNATWRIPIYH